MKPLIGITMNLVKNDQLGIDNHIGGKGQSWQALADHYVQAVKRAGGIPVLLPITGEPGTAEAYVDAVDGILFSGGGDISPLYYGEAVTEKVGEISTERDEQEFSLMSKALQKENFPVFGICRGCQLLNIATGGSLVADIDVAQAGNHFLEGQRMDVLVHTIEKEAGSLIDKLMGGENRVNSYHHQCIKTPGEGGKITARDRNGIPECLEIPGRKGFTLGVQWHPEGLEEKYEGHAEIFNAFVRAAAENKRR